MSSSGDPLRTDEWDTWCVEEWWPSFVGTWGRDRASLLSVAPGFQVPGNVTHAVVYELTDETPDRVAEVTDALRMVAPEDRVPSGRTHVTTFEKISAHVRRPENGGRPGVTARGALIVFTDPLCDAQEPAYNEWYESHHPVSLARAGGYQRLTRYVATDVRPWQNKYLTIYETDEPDVGRIHREGLDWYFSKPRPPEDEAPLRLWWEVPFDRRA
jgi:hypothetical protein